jgi:hypothetical protein
MPAEKISFKFLLFLLAVLCLWSAAAAAEKPLNIIDYLLLIPEKYLGFEKLKIPTPERLAMIEENDSQNGWLKLIGKGENTFEGWVELALFSKGPDGPMIGVTVNQCGPLCEQQIHFLQFRENECQEITGRVFQPLPADKVQGLYQAGFPSDEFADDPPVLYRLPRRGTDIILVTQEAIVNREVVLARFRIVNGRFILRSSAPE